jgi:hypothetical protein
MQKYAKFIFCITAFCGSTWTKFMQTPLIVGQCAVLKVGQQTIKAAASPINCRSHNTLLTKNKLDKVQYSQSRQGQSFSLSNIKNFARYVGENTIASEQ